MKYEEWIERKYFFFLECDSLILFEEDPDDNGERERVFKIFQSDLHEEFKEEEKK